MVKLLRDRPRPPAPWPKTAELQFLNLMINAKYEAKAVYQKTHHFVDYSHEIQTASDRYFNSYFNVSVQDIEASINTLLNSAKDVYENFDEFKRISVRTPNAKYERLTFRHFELYRADMTMRNSDGSLRTANDREIKRLWISNTLSRVYNLAPFLQPALNSMQDYFLGSTDDLKKLSKLSCK